MSRKPAAKVAKKAAQRRGEARSRRPGTSAASRLNGKDGEAGRPSLLTERLLPIVARAMSRGATWALLCDLLNVKYSTLKEWRRRGIEDIEALSDADRDTLYEAAHDAATRKDPKWRKMDALDKKRFTMFARFIALARAGTSEFGMKKLDELDLAGEKLDTKAIFGQMARRFRKSYAETAQKLELTGRGGKPLGIKGEIVIGRLHLPPNNRPEGKDRK